jgi:hypothetical protein
MDRWLMVFDAPPCNNREVPYIVFGKITGIVYFQVTM